MSRYEEEGATADSVTAVERPPVRVDEGAASLPEGTVLAGRYEVRKTIGRGGMGQVVEAFDRTLGVSVAIKIVRGDQVGERQWSERLAREVTLARKIQHPNVCRVFDFAQADGRAFLSMELASGGTLRSQASDSTARARPLTERLSDVRAIAAGMGAIHAAGIVHRDLSQQNVLRMADGRLVVSDFGLATDSLDGTMSIQGGTVAYMAPEVLRGRRATFASDVWSLGALIHEVVFGAPMGSGDVGSSLTRVERSILEICRACTSVNPASRPRNAGEIASRLTDAGLARAGSRRRGRRTLAGTAAVLVLVAAVVGGRQIRSVQKRRAVPVAPVDPLMIIPTGTPEDWTEKSQVLAEVPGKVRCVVPLGDKHTLRFVWGYPAHAEDLDTHSGERKESHLVPDAYAEGCPDLSSDGKRLVYAGHSRDDRAFAFVSAHADGRDAVPEVQMGEPGEASDPVWLSDGETFVYDVDDKHVAAFSMATKRSLVMPTATSEFFTSFHEVIGNRIFVISFVDGLKGTEVSGFEYPRLNEIAHWRLPMGGLDLQSADGKRYYFSVMRGETLALLEVEPAANRARFLGAVSGQHFRRPIFVEDGLAFGTVKGTSTLVLRAPGQEPKRVPIADGIALASACGERIIGTRTSSGRFRSVWLDAQGKITGTFPPDAGMDYLTCSSDGKVMFGLSFGEKPGIRRCDGGDCRLIFAGGAAAGPVALSPDENRLAFVSAENGGRVVKWISSNGVGGAHDIVDSGSGCQPIWSSDKDIWVSLRKGRQVIWTEIDTSTARATGRTSPGLRDCTDGMDDPQRPLHDPVEVEVGLHYQLRLLPAKDLPPA